MEMESMNRKHDAAESWWSATYYYFVYCLWAVFSVLLSPKPSILPREIIWPHFVAVRIRTVDVD